ncbi:DUF1616 domain-containing protein [Haloarchaeobius sp. DFWS5]|uniref:DUF1616 domain-containing protein n=1 Tax=Haloarchaeobius sp. DFWS5 TaxID=3446114 RepID=UPI003EBD9D69
MDREKWGERAEWTGVAVTGLLVLSLAIGIASTGYVLSMSETQETEFSVLTRDDFGELASDGYPRTVQQGESVPLVVSITNHEPASEYVLVVQMQQVRTNDDGTVATVVESSTLTRERITVGSEETRRIPYDLEPTMTGENVRVRFLLYRVEDGGAAEKRPHRSLQLWMNVSNNTQPNSVEIPGDTGHPVSPPADESQDDEKQARPLEPDAGEFIEIRPE